MSEMNVTTPATVSKARKPAAKAAKKAAPKKSVAAEPAQAEVVQALENAPVIIAPRKKLVRSALNARQKKKHSREKLVLLARSIKKYGVLQNLVAYLNKNGDYAIAAGEGRVGAIDVMIKDGDATDDYGVPLKIVPKEIARLVSIEENDKRTAMHPSDQINNFRELADEGHTPVEIGVLTGYTTQQVKQMLRLSDMAPELLEELAADTINIDQLKALSANTDQQRQLNVWQNAVAAKDEWYLVPARLRSKVLEEKVAVNEESTFSLVDQDEYERAGGTLSHDLFTEDGFIEDAPLLERLLIEKLEYVGESLRQAEGWKWVEVFPNYFSEHGDLAKPYAFLPSPARVYSVDEQAYIDALKARTSEIEAIFSSGAHKNLDDAAQAALRQESKQCQDTIDAARSRAKLNSWTESDRLQAGIIISVCHGEIQVKRGVMRKSDVIKEKPEKTADKGLSSTLVHELSIERTLAVQSALAKQPNIAIVLFIHDCLKDVFGEHCYYASALKCSLNYQHHSLLSTLPIPETEHQAGQEMAALHAEWAKKLPEGWEDDCRWLLEWEQADQMALLGFCLAGALDKSEHHPNNKGKIASKLEPVEQLIGFTLRDHWKPTAKNYFGRIGKDQIVDALNAAGQTGAATDASKMKKGDAADFAESALSQTRWVPTCMIPEPTGADTTAAADYESTSDASQTVH